MQWRIIYCKCYKKQSNGNWLESTRYIWSLSALPLKIVKSYKYLSVWFSSSNAWKQHDSELVSKTLVAMYVTYKALDKLLALRSFTIQNRFLYAKFLPTLLYGSELTAFGVNTK